MVPDKGATECLVKTIADFMSRCGFGRANLNSNGEPTIVALQEAVKNARQGHKILEHTPRGDSQSNGAVESAVREEGMIRTKSMFVQKQLQ